MFNLIKKFIKNRLFGRFKKYNDEFIYRSGLAALNSSRVMYATFNSLYQAELKVFSQYGEDGIIDFLLFKLDIFKPSFIEIGTEDYSESNTRFLYQRTNCEGLIIDCDPLLEQKASRVLGDYYWKGNLSAISSFITKDNILENLGINKSNSVSINQDIFSLDIDGNDYWILSKIIPYLKSKIIILEYNPYFGGDHKVSVPYDPNFNRNNFHHSNLCWGASIKAFYELMLKFDYIFIGSNLNNNNGFWIRKDLLNKVNIEIPTIDQLNDYTCCYCRESRDEKNKMTYLSGSMRLNEIKSCKLVNLDSSINEINTIEKIFNL